MTRTKKTPLERVLSNLGALQGNRAALLQVKEIVDYLLEELEQPGETPDAPPESQDREPSSARSGARRVELKLINGYGPYAYYRQWKSGTHTSTYIGKASESAAREFWARRDKS